MANKFWTYFVQTFLYGLLLSSCITQQKCLEKYPPVVKDSIIVVTKDTVIHDTVTVAGELIFWSDTIPCPELNYSKSETKNNLTSFVKIKNGKIKVLCKADSLLLVVDSLVRTIEINSSKVQTVEVPTYINHWYDKPSHILAILFLIALAFWLGKQIFKLKL